MPGTAAWRRSRTWISTTRIDSGRRSRRLPARRPPSSSEATSPSPVRRPMPLVMASMADKDGGGIVPAPAGASALDDATIVATALDLPRAMPAAEVAARWRAHGQSRKIVVEADAERALDRALADADGPIV